MADTSGRGVTSRAERSPAGTAAAAEAPPVIDKDRPTMPTAGTTSLLSFPFDARGMIASILGRTTLGQTLRSLAVLDCPERKANTPRDRLQRPELHRCASSSAGSWLP